MYNVIHMVQSRGMGSAWRRPRPIAPQPPGISHLTLIEGGRSGTAPRTRRGRRRGRLAADLAVTQQRLGAAAARHAPGQVSRRMARSISTRASPTASRLRGDTAPRSSPTVCHGG